MIKQIAIGLLFCSLVTGCSQQQSNQNANQEPNEWEILFDGESTDKWRMYNGGSCPERGWKVEDGMMVFEPVEEDGAEGSQNIITKKKYKNFHLKLEWQLGEGSNSGVFYGVLEQLGEQIYWSAPEMQIIDNSTFEGREEGNDNRMSGSLYDLVAAEPQNANPPGQWNSIQIIVDGAKVEHWQNGAKVLEVERWTTEWFEMIRNSKFECHNEFGNVREGHIGIQDHGGLVKIRNIKIKEL